VLRHRAEQALLGALIAGGDPAVVKDVRAGDFTDRVHQAIFAAITRQDQYRRGRLASRVQLWLARLCGPRLASVVAYLEQLPALSPRHGHLLLYGVMVLQSRQQAMASRSQEHGSPDAQLTGADLWLSSAAGGRRSGKRSGGHPAAHADGGDRLAAETERLARALAPAMRRVRERGSSQGGAGRTGGGTVLANGADGGAFRGADVQELVLAGLMRHPGRDGPGLVGRVPPEVFGSRDRQELYTVIRRIIAARLPLDPLIAAWEAHRREASRDAQAPPDAPGRESAAVLALRLGEMPAAPGMAGVLCRGLLGDYELTRMLGPGWPRKATIQPADAPRVPGAPRVRPAPSRPEAGPAEPQAWRRPPEQGPGGRVPRHG
jgi:hypothetical protein